SSAEVVVVRIGRLKTTAPTVEATTAAATTASAHSHGSVASTNDDQPGNRSRIHGPRAAQATTTPRTAAGSATTSASDAAAVTRCPSSAPLAARSPVARMRRVAPRPNAAPARTPTTTSTATSNPAERATGAPGSEVASIHASGVAVEARDSIDGVTGPTIDEVRTAVSVSAARAAERSSAGGGSVPAGRSTYTRIALTDADPSGRK